MTRVLRSPLLYPYLLALHPALMIYSRNMDEISSGELLKPLVVLLIAVTVALLLFRLLVRDWDKAALMVALGVLMFFSYGFVYLKLVLGLMIGDFNLGRHRFFQPVWILAYIGLCIPILRARVSLKEVARFLNVFALVLIALVLVNIISHEARTNAKQREGTTWHEVMAAQVDSEMKSLSPKQPVRDIYYLIMDQYARADTLKRVFGYDNSDFIKELRRRGFYVADKSLSSYKCTYPSLSSSLNYCFLTDLAEPTGTPANSRRLLRTMIHDCKIVHVLKRMGYEFVFFPTEWQTTYSHPLADVSLRPHSLQLNEYDRALIRESMLRPMVESQSARRRELFYIFGALPSIADMKEPTFTLAHIVCPHGPVCVDKDGKEPVAPLVQVEVKGARQNARMRALYVGQVQYANKRLLEDIDKILAKSKVPPIIIIQGDHGPGPSVVEAPDDATEFGILNAYYLPGGGEKLLWPTISPVNSFRIVLNHYFGGRYEILPDRTSEEFGLLGR